MEVEEKEQRVTTRDLFNLISQYKPTNSVLWDTVAEQYRLQQGESEASLEQRSKSSSFKECVMAIESQQEDQV